MTDRYTKATLTIIAVALVAIVVQNSVGPVGAQTGVQRVVICDAADTTRCATVAERHYGGSRFGFLGVSEGQK